MHTLFNWSTAHFASVCAGFQWSYRPNMAFPALFSSAGYRTAGYGKIFHWDGNDKNIWNYDQWDGGWYDYQKEETGGQECR